MVKNYWAFTTIAFSTRANISDRHSAAEVESAACELIVGKICLATMASGSMDRKAPYSCASSSIVIADGVSKGLAEGLNS